MKKIATLMAAAAFVGAAGLAHAESVSGTVRSFDASTMTVELENGMTYPVQPGIDATALEAGAVVTLNVENVGGSDTVTAVSIN